MKLRNLFRLLVLNFFLLNSFVYAQKYDFNWIIGDNQVITRDSIFGSAFLDFNSQDGNPFIKTNVALNHMLYYGAMVSDAEGKFMLRFNGYYLEDYTKKWVPGYQKICPDFLCAFSSQSCLFLPSLLNSSKYTLFTDELELVGDTFAYPINLRYNFHQFSNKSDAKGFTILSTNNKLISDSLDIGKLTACKHANGRDWWIIIGRSLKPEFYTILFDGNMIVKSFKQNVSRNFNAQAGFNCFSPNGMYYCSTSKAEDNIYGVGSFDFYNFDRCTGLLTKLYFDTLDSSVCFGIGCSFSPDSRFLYLSTAENLYQYEIIDGELKNKVVVGIYDGVSGHLFDNVYSTAIFGSIVPGPDGRLYMNSDFLQSRYLHVIDKPNQAGNKCDFKQRSIFLNSIITTLPNFPTFRLGPLDGSICDSLGIDNMPWCWWRYDQDTTNHLCINFSDQSAYLPIESDPTWSWDFGDGTSSSEISPTHCFAKIGIYKVCLLIKNKFGADTLCRTLYLGTSKTKEGLININNIQLFPNPTTDFFIINLFDYIPQKKLILKMYDLTGNEVKMARIFQGTNTITTEKLLSGIYFVNLIEKGKIVYSQKLIIN